MTDLKPATPGTAARCEICRVLWLWLSAEYEAECMPLWGDEEIGHA